MSFTCFSLREEASGDTFPGPVDMRSCMCVYRGGYWLNYNQSYASVCRSVVLLGCKSGKHPCSLDLKGHIKREV